MFGFFRRLKAGNQLMSSLITGNLDDSELGRQLAVWFAERPARVTQRNMFVQVVCGMGAKLLRLRILDSGSLRLIGRVCPQGVRLLGAKMGDKLIDSGVHRSI